jgi:hypothetical protein
MTMVAGLEGAFVYALSGVDVGSGRGLNEHLGGFHDGHG